MDGSRYDFAAPWALDVLLAQLEVTLEALDKAESEDQRVILRKKAASLNTDLISLHGINLMD